MEFKQGMVIGARLEQRLVMTQQLQQAIRLLALSRQELVEQIHEALNENPVLEEMAQRSDAQTSSAVTSGEGEVTHLDAQPGREKASAEVDWGEYFADLARGPSEGGGGGGGSRDEELPPLHATLSRDATLEELLREQVGVAGLSEVQREIAAEIIGDLDDDGYYRPCRLELRGGTDAGRRLLRSKAERAGLASIEAADLLALLWLTEAETDEWAREAEGRGMRATRVPGSSTRALAERFGVSQQEVEGALAAVQTCEPLGIAAPDLRACLLVQARALYPENASLHRLIDRHLPNIEARKQAAILRDLGADEPTVRALLALLATLEPRPGRSYSGESARYITPDVEVRKVGDDYTVQVNDDGLPKLRVSRYYRALLEGGGPEKEYLNEKMRQAQWMIRSIHQRQSTILRVTESIMRFQRPFLERGVAHLRPLVLREVAEDVGLHESTVSRVTTNKYVQTPQGIFELKYFFNSRISADAGPDLASEAVKHAIKKLIDAELRRAPLSDQEIAEILQGQWDRAQLLARLDVEASALSGLVPAKTLSIARRTVAKYREAMNIASSSRRRAML
jgi:RNA polymerase sigma-54 factor